MNSFTCTEWGVNSRYFALCAVDCVKLYTTTLREFNLLHEVLILSKPVQKLENIIYRKMKSQKALSISLFDAKLI